MEIFLFNIYSKYKKYKNFKYIYTIFCIIQLYKHKYALTISPDNRFRDLHKTWPAIEKSCSHGTELA